MDFAELHCLSNYSFLRGASHPEELVQQAAALGYRARALTDECSFGGLVKAHMAAEECGLKLIVGAEFRFREADEEFHLVLLAPNRSAYGQLSALITLCRRRAPKGTYTARLRDFRCGGSECLALWIPGNSMKLAEVAWMKEKTGQWPVLLLDEVLAELDQFRREDLLAHLVESEQILMTTTDLELFSPEFVRKATLWQIQAGRVSEVNNDK